MAKEKTVYFCTNCGNESVKWVGKCSGCNEWNTFVERTLSTKKSKSEFYSAEELQSKTPQTLSSIDTKNEERIDMCDEELNRVLGGGLVYGSLVLLGGEPGIGKSTLILQTVLQIDDKKILYVSGEERVKKVENS